MNILALDLATFTGWATLIDGKIKFGSEKFVDPNWDGHGARYLKYEKWLNSFDTKFDLIAYETVMAHSAVYASHVYGAYLSEVMKLGERTKTPYVGFGVKAIKKFWAGNGNASKKDMMNKSWDLGFNVKDDNQADALGILHLAESEYKPPQSGWA